MIVTETRLPLEEEKFILEPSTKKIRTDSSSTTDSNLETAEVRNLELEGVKELFQDYDLQENEDVSCVICGKGYKSKVCVKKHLWEHSIYWDLFDGLKKQQRVLSIQAAIILAIKFNPSLSLLLVTNSSSGQKKKNNTNSITTSSNSSNRHNQMKNLPTTNSTATLNGQFNRKRKFDDVSKPTFKSNSSNITTPNIPKTLYKMDGVENSDNFTF